MSSKAGQVLNNIVVSVYSNHYKAYEEKTYSVIRPYKLTYAGAARVIAKMTEDKPSEINVVRIESLIYL